MCGGEAAKRFFSIRALHFRRHIPMRTKNLAGILLVIVVVATALAAQTGRRPFKLDDLARLREVRDPQVSPDGQWVAYVVATIDSKVDKSSSHIWMVGYDGKNDRQITFS